jgi:hypothetical protein
VKIETPHQSIALDDIPNADAITQIVVDLQDQRGEITYRGHPAMVYRPTVSTALGLDVRSTL